MSYILIILMVLLYTVQPILGKNYSENYPGESRLTTPVFTITSGLVVALVSFVFSGLRFSAVPLTVALGILNGIFLYGYNYFMLKASQSGSYSVMTIFSLAGGIIIPTIVARIAFGDSISMLGFAFILLIFVSVYLMSKKERQETDSIANKVTKKFLLLCFGIGICNGAYGTLLDVQQRLTGAAEKEEMVTITFFCAAVISLISLLMQKTNISSAIKQTRTSAIYLAAYSIVAAMAINVMVCALPLVNVTVLYTIDNASVMLLSVLCSCFLFKEKLSVVNIIGCVTMCIGLVGMTLSA